MLPETFSLITLKLWYLQIVENLIYELLKRNPAWLFDIVLDIELVDCMQLHGNKSDDRKVTVIKCFSTLFQDVWHKHLIHGSIIEPYYTVCDKYANCMWSVQLMFGVGYHIRQHYAKTCEYNNAHCMILDKMKSVYLRQELPLIMWVALLLVCAYYFWLKSDSESTSHPQIRPEWSLHPWPVGHDIILILCNWDALDLTIIND